MDRDDNDMLQADPMPFLLVDNAMSLRRSLVLLVAVALIGCMDQPGPVAERDAAIETPANDAEPAKPDAAVIAAWEEAGFEFGWMDVYDYSFLTPQEKSEPSLNVCDIPAFSFTEGGALGESLRGLPQPCVPFGLVCESANDAALKELAGLKQLRWLDLLLAHEVTDAGLRELARMKQLQMLDLLGARVTDAGLKELSGLAQLETLSLFKTNVTDDGLKELTRMKQLETLNLGGTQVTDVGLPDLARMTQLRSLDLSVTEVTDAGLEHLKGLTNLDVLSLWGTKVTDAGLVHLKGLSGLRLLNLWKTQVTVEGVKKLQEALPDCYIRR
jgi:hypothetical protein